MSFIFAESVWKLPGFQGFLNQNRLILDSHHVQTHETDCVQYQTLDWWKVQQKQSITDFVHWGTLNKTRSVTHYVQYLDT